jgi:hypothetical protein
VINSGVVPVKGRILNALAVSVHYEQVHVQGIADQRHLLTGTRVAFKIRSGSVRATFWLPLAADLHYRPGLSWGHSYSA